MTYNNVEEYILSLPEDRQLIIHKIRETILNNLPEGFEEVIQYNMISYVVPHKLYPSGYHCDPKLPLPFISLASQKNYVSFYHMGIYADEKLLNWFTEAYKTHAKYKLDMGKSCIRFKRMDDIPYDLLGELLSKMTVGRWVELYENSKN
ncbi:DUF1801 domain-containing protein [Acidaminobacter sp. JC074]|uniref:DUF1801 domain-containing protein n=1 Tax=Acidaminobacter sp. JC074 TaxID=2530199 RepID=UPI001F10F62B|nr:DUF1801 domain-containing protein [Acidaminobacter sp. JC074]MCH4890974.1 DUF1801 domain-containing protein [Acidaminobacter sp. JC074]